MTTLAAALAIAGPLTFVALVVYLHFKRPDINPIERGISRYAVDATIGLTAAALIALSVGFAGILLATNTGDAIGRTLVGIAALGLLLASVPIPQPGQPSWWGPIHTIGGLMFFLGSAAGLTLMSPAFGRTAELLSKALVVSVILFFAGAVRLPPLGAIRGLLQRACFAAVVVWLIVAGWRHLG